VRLLSRFGLPALVGFSVSSLIALSSYSLGLWLGRNSYNLRWIIYASIPFALLVGIAAVVQPKHEPGRKRTLIVAVLLGAFLAFVYTVILGLHGLATTAFIVLMLSCWVPGGVSAMAVAARAKQLPVVAGVTVLCVAAIVLTEPVFNLVTRNQRLTVAIATPSTMQLEALPEDVGFHGDDETRAAKNEVLERIRSLDHTETFRVLSITREGKGRESLAVIIIRAPVTKEVQLPVPDRSTVVYTQRSDGGWEKTPANAPVLHRAVTIRPPVDAGDRSLGYFAIPDAQGISLTGRIAEKAASER
jgi:hypothetical protein